ncbi:MAG: hypothetical protein NT049_00655 [Planctomycetota bacterium]|nr:hypothetical protein [Planctomycetota bacterium]
MKPQIKALERDRDKASPDGQAMIDSLGKRVSDKVHALIEKSGDAYYQVAEFKKALPLFMSVYQEIPEDKRGAEKALTEKIADLCGKTGDPKTATHLYEGLYKAMSENDRKNWATFDLRHNMAKFYFEKMNDYKMALEIYKGMLETIEPAKRDTDGGWIKKEIAKCEEKLGGKSSSTPAGGKGNPATKAGGH